MKKIFLLGLIIFSLSAFSGHASGVQPSPDETVTFLFKSGDPAFYNNEIDHNRQTLKELYTIIERYRNRINSGEMPVYVNGYSSSGIAIAQTRSNHVKSDLILHQGLKEQHFITNNQEGSYQGANDVVVVSLVINKQAEQTVTAPAKETRPAVEPQPEVKPEKEQPAVVQPAEEQPVVAEQAPKKQTAASSATPSPWYIGASAGLSFGVSTFSSFADDKTYTGYNFGLLGGYTLNNYLSAEVSLAFSHLELGTSKCCADYWLGADGARYLAAVAGEESYSYRDVYSSVSMQQLGLHLNADLVKLFAPRSESRWSAWVSPALYGVGYRSTIQTIQGDNEVYKDDYKLRLGAGADVAAGYRLNKRIGLRLGTGINWILGGGRFDGVPTGSHHSNYVWNSNLTFIWHLP